MACSSFLGFLPFYVYETRRLVTQGRAEETPRKHRRTGGGSVRSVVELTDEEAAQWITTGDPRIPYTPGLPESGAALRAAALALSAKAIAIQAQRLKELRAASQIN